MTSSQPPPSRPKRKRGGQPGNRNSYKHGFYAKNFSCDERRNLSHKPDLESELKAARVIANRMLARLNSYGLGPEDEGVIDKATMTAVNEVFDKFNSIARLARSHQLVSGQDNPVETSIMSALHDITEKDGWDNA
jgi:hypothetical protein